MTESWRTVVRWSDAVTGETGEFADTIEAPHAVILQLMLGGVRLKLRGKVAHVSGQPLVDFAERTIEYWCELFPL